MTRKPFLSVSSSLNAVITRGHNGRVRAYASAVLMRAVSDKVITFINNSTESAHNQEVCVTCVKLDVF